MSTAVMPDRSADPLLLDHTEVTPDEVAADATQQLEDRQTERRAALVARYGSEFPLLDVEDPTEVEDGAWLRWARWLKESRRAQMTMPLYIAQRNRLFYRGRQWLSSEGPTLPWDEPPKPRDTVRMTVNVIRPALNLRQAIISEQRPGFRANPTNRDSQTTKRAEAGQILLEYQFGQQQMDEIHSEIGFWAGTDGCAFLEVYWDVDAGPWHQMLPPAVPGQPLTESAAAPSNMSTNPGERVKMGDPRPRVVRIDEVSVAANATATERPDWICIRRVIPVGDAVARWGDAVASETPAMGAPGADNLAAWTDAGRTDDRLLDSDTVEEYTVYCEPGDELPAGLTLRVIGHTVQFVGPLLFGLVPVVRYTDGSTDPAYFPEPAMNDWVDDQVAINMLASKWVESIRRNAGGALLSRPQAIAAETMILGTLSLVEVKGAGPLDDVVKPLPQFSIGQDTKELMQFYVKQFEGKSGWNDATRGSFSSDQSGRAILAVREQVERVFAPLVGATARGCTAWAKVTLAACRYGYDLPRLVQISGKSRLDLAQEMTGQDIEGVDEVTVDPETLMPMPRSLKLFLLEQLRANQLIPPDQYLRLMPFAFVRDAGNGDEDDRARAFRITDQIRRGVPEAQLPAALPMDNAPIHMDTLRREILLNDDLPAEVRAVAFDRYMQYQQMMTPPPPAAPPGAAGGAPPPKAGGPTLPPDQAPLSTQNSSVAAAPQGLSASDQQSAGAQFDAMSPA